MPENDERRQELRVRLGGQVWFNILEGPSQYVRSDTPGNALVGPVASGPELEGKDELEEFLLRLDAKLDFIINVLTDNLVRKDFHFKGRLLEVSESGLRFIAPQDLALGTWLELGLRLPHQPHRTMDIAGEVTWRAADTEAGAEAPRYAVGVRFTDILSEDRDAIVHYIFQKQREEIRRSKT